MRIATGIIGLVFSVGMFLQTMAVYGLSNLGDDDATTQAGAVGLLAAFLMFVGGALVFGLPRLALVVFVLSALSAFAGSGDFPDLAYWGGLALVLAAMSFLGWRGKRRAEVKERLDREAVIQGAVAAGLAVAVSVPMARSAICPKCLTPLSPAARFCDSCGLEQAFAPTYEFCEVKTVDQPMRGLTIVAEVDNQTETYIAAQKFIGGTKLPNSRRKDVEQIVSTLERDGWERQGMGPEWWSYRLRRVVEAEQPGGRQLSTNGQTLSVDP